MNQVILVGRIANIERIENKENEIKRVVVTIAVQRNFKSVDGIYETDFIDCNLLGHVSDTTFEFCSKGDVIGIHGRLNIIEGKITVIADKVTFLSCKK